MKYLILFSAFLTIFKFSFAQEQTELDIGKKHNYKFEKPKDADLNQETFNAGFFKVLIDPL